MRRRLLPATSGAPHHAASPLPRLSTLVSDLFMPSFAGGGPPPEYIRFQVLDAVQAACSYLRGVLTLHTTLTGAGVSGGSGDGGGSGMGPAATAATAVVLATILKDGSGHVGSLLFGYALAPRLDGEVRFWRLAADLANDVGLTLELAAPMAGPGWFLYITCAANVWKALCGVAAGGTRVAISQAFARRGGNVAEVAAKEGVQETAVTLLGLLAGYLFAARLNSSPSLQWAAFGALTVVHVLANYAAVKCLRLASLNRSRAYMLGGGFSAAVAGGGGAGVRAWAPPSPADVAAAEPVLLPVRYAGALLDAVPSAVVVGVAGVLRRMLGWPLLAEGFTTPDGALARVPLPLRAGVPLPAALPPSAVVLCRGGAGGGDGYTCQRVAEWEAAGGGDERDGDLAVL